jgi:ADP-heptose:LPS heptosyltransferase
MPALVTTDYRSILLLKPCCIGDVIMATPLLAALRRAYPAAILDWAVSSSGLGAIGAHPSLRRVIDTGPRANPAAHPRSLLTLIGLLRRGRYDLVVVPDRSPLLGLATLLAGIPARAGLDSAGRGFAYTTRAPIIPAEVRHEAAIYLEVGRALGIDVHECWANVPPSPAADQAATQVIAVARLNEAPFVIIHPGGGVNAGMSMTSKRWPPQHFAAFADRLAAQGLRTVIVGAASDREVVAQVKANTAAPVTDLTEQLTLPTIGALAARAVLYVGNDNGVAHLAAASGGRVLMIFGPSDPRRYAPFVPPDRARAVWREVTLPAAGVVAGTPTHFDWERDGVGVDEVWNAAQALLRQRGSSAAMLAQ